MKLTKLFYSIFFVSLTLKAENLVCTIKKNTSVVYNQNINLSTRSSYLFPEVDGLRSNIKNLGSSQFEIEVFDPRQPARNYSNAILKEDNSYLKYSMWDREILLEIVCVLKQSRTVTVKK